MKPIKLNIPADKIDSFTINLATGEVEVSLDNVHLPPEMVIGAQRGDVMSLHNIILELKRGNDGCLPTVVLHNGKFKLGWRYKRKAIKKEN